MIMATARKRSWALRPNSRRSKVAQRYGTEDDDELILRALVQGRSQKMRAAGPVKRIFRFCHRRTRPGSAAHARRQVAGGANLFGCARSI
jgi:hypothetical protein